MVVFFQFRVKEAPAAEMSLLNIKPGIMYFTMGGFKKGYAGQGLSTITKKQM